MGWLASNPLNEVTNLGIRRRCWPGWRLGRDELLIGLFAVAATCALKLHYMMGDVVALNWILEPTAVLVQGLTGASYLATDRGYLFPNTQIGRLLIAPSCAGLNFVIVTFWVGLMGFARSLSTLRGRLVWVVMVAVSAVLAALVVNGFRIALSVHLGPTAAEFGVSWAQLHRMLGVLLELFTLSLSFLSVRRMFRRRERTLPMRTNRGVGRFARSIALPVVCYLGVAVVLPLLNGAHQRAGFFLHAATIVLLGGLLVGGAAILDRVSPHKRLALTPHKFGDACRRLSTL